jgi:hypothetical protein
MPEVEVIEFALEEIVIEMDSPAPEVLVTMSAPIPQSELSAVAWSGVIGKPTVFTPANHTHVEVEITDLEPTVDLTVWFENQLA